MRYEYITKVNADRSDVFEWFEHRGSFRRLMPPWEISEEVHSDEAAASIGMGFTLFCNGICGFIIAIPLMSNTSNLE